MPAPQIISLPPGFVLSDGMQIKVTAVDATTGNTVSGVTVANVSIDVDPTTAAESSPVVIPDETPWLVPTA